MKHIVAVIFALSLAIPADAARMRSEAEEYLSANLVAVFYHELGHALIDVMKLPIFGQEEDAADVLSVFLLDALYEPEVAIEMAYHNAYGWLGESKNSSGSDPAFWDVHGPDQQRFYTFVCLFYGADIRGRKDLANDLDLPAPRQRTCKKEYEQAKESWGKVVERLYSNGPGKSIRILADNRIDEFGKFTAEVIRAEVARMNAELSLPKRILVRVEDCGVINAFYDSKTREITMCSEYARYLARLQPR